MIRHAIYIFLFCLFFLGYSSAIKPQSQCKNRAADSASSCNINSNPRYAIAIASADELGQSKRASSSTKYIPRDPVIKNGWRIDGCFEPPYSCDATPDKAEEQLGVKVTRTNRYFKNNAWAQLYGKYKLRIKTFEVLERTPFNTMMQLMVFLNKPSFAFGYAKYEEYILGINPQYAVTGWVNATSCVVYGPQADPGGYGSMTVESIEDDVWTILYRSKARGLLRMTAYPIPI